MIKNYDFPNLYRNIVGDVISVSPRNCIKALTEFKNFQILFNINKSQTQGKKSAKSTFKKINAIGVKSNKKEIVRRVKFSKTMGNQNMALNNRESEKSEQPSEKITFRNYLKKSKFLKNSIRNSNNEPLIYFTKQKVQPSIKMKEQSSNDDNQLSSKILLQSKDTLEHMETLLVTNNRNNIRKRKHLSSFINFQKKFQVEKEKKNDRPKVIKSNFKIKSKVVIQPRKSEMNQQMHLQKFTAMKYQSKDQPINKKKNVQFIQASPLSSVANTNIKKKDEILISKRSNKKLKKSTRYKPSKCKIEQLFGQNTSQSNPWTEKSLVSLKFDKQSITKNIKKMPDYQRQFMETENQYSRQIKLNRGKYNTKIKKYIVPFEIENNKFASLRGTFDNDLKPISKKKKKFFKKKTLVASHTSIRSKVSIVKPNHRNDRKNGKKVAFHNYQKYQTQTEYFIQTEKKFNNDDQDQLSINLQRDGQNIFFKKGLTLRKMKQLDQPIQNTMKLNIFDELNYFNAFINENYSDISSQQNDKCMMKPMVICNEIKMKEVTDYGKMRKQNLMFDMGKAIGKNLFSLAQKTF